MISIPTLKLIRRHIIALINVLDRIEQTQTPEPVISRAEIIAEIRAYGLNIDELIFLGFTDEQLLAILEALQQMGTQFIELAKECQNTEVDPEITPDQYFQQVFDRPIKTFYDRERDFTAVNSTDDRHDIIFAPSAFTNRDDIPYSIETIKQIVIHEFGHIFHNELLYTQAEESAQDIIIAQVTDPEDNIHRDFQLSVEGDTPQVVIDYLIATKGYYSGSIGLDFGKQRDSGRYTRADAQAYNTIVALTKDVYKQGFGTVPCDDDCPDDTLVNESGNCLKDGNRCIPVSEASTTSSAVYVRAPATYFPKFSRELRDDNEALQLFQNERGITTEASAPKEGFADMFAVFLDENKLASLPENEPRKLFFENNFCQWIKQLMRGE